MKFQREAANEQTIDCRHPPALHAPAGPWLSTIFPFDVQLERCLFQTVFEIIIHTMWTVDSHLDPDIFSTRQSMYW